MAAGFAYQSDNRLKEFFRIINLPELHERFEDENVDFETLMDFNDDELKEMNLSIGHRKKIAKNISNFKTNPSSFPTLMIQQQHEICREL